MPRQQIIKPIDKSYTEIIEAVSKYTTKEINPALKQHKQNKAKSKSRNVKKK